MFAHIILLHSLWCIILATCVCTQLSHDLCCIVDESLYEEAADEIVEFETSLAEVIRFECTTHQCMEPLCIVLCACMQ